MPVKRGVTNRQHTSWLCETANVEFWISRKRIWQWIEKLCIDASWKNRKCTFHVGHTTHLVQVFSVVSTFASEQFHWSVCLFWNESHLYLYLVSHHHKPRSYNFSLACCNPGWALLMTRVNHFVNSGTRLITCISVKYCYQQYFWNWISFSLLRSCQRHTMVPSFVMILK